MIKKQVEKNGACELVYPGKVTEAKALSVKAAPLIETKAFGQGPSLNMLIHGENLPVLKTLLEMKQEGLLRNGDGSKGVRLVYIDPPFATNLSFKSKKEHRAYDDKIIGPSFIEFLRKRLILLRELLSDDGSIFVHLDWKKAHSIKIIMDEVFSEENFLNDIVWSYGGRGAKAIASQFSRNHDIILWYGGKHRVFNQQFTQKRVRKGEAGFREDSSGRWFKTSPRGDYTDASIAALRKDGRVYETKNGNIRIKYFLKEDGDRLIEDKLVGDVWDDIPDAMHLSTEEKTGYPTQKPEALLARIINAASNNGDLVLDAFAGAGTTLAVAEKLGRRWIGIDSGELSMRTVEERLLSIASSKSLENPKRRFGKGPRPFSLFEAGESAHCHKRPTPKVKSRYSIDEKTDTCVIKIERFGEKGVDALSSVMIDTAFDGEVFRPSVFHFAESLKANNYEIRLPLSECRGEVMMVYAAASGDEAWHIGEVV
ncbi:MAG: site-specific DNA-methyltransferase [Deltaproteobacteria bacterium]|nr:site-specific DNA-methyltransferase [Deltaproteobacteria bacterium]